jgi:DNA-binding NtrC family response regulator
MNDTPPSTDAPHVLAVDDEVLIHGVLERLFTREGIQVTTCSNGKDAIERLETESFDLVLTDFMMPKMDGLELLAHIREHHPATSVIMITAHDNVQHAVRAMQKGAIDYIPKPFSTDELVDRVESALREQEMRDAAESTSLSGDGRAGGAPSAPTPSGSGSGTGAEEDDTDASSHTSVTYIGEHESIQRLKKMLPRVAQSQAPVFVHGESGTGKEILSRLIHERSDRREAPYVTINCANLPSELVESHLFGHVEGAFTGAVDDMVGAFEKADGGTLLLDEVTEVDPTIQAKLLRVLQEQEFQKVGAGEKQSVNVRVIATSNRDLKQAMQDGDFREDLYHRLAVFPLHVPPLRGRLSDIPHLAEHFVEKYTTLYGFPPKTIDPDLLQYFQTYRWPGNVRELENMIHRGVVLAADTGCITKDDVLNDFFADRGTTSDTDPADEILAETGAMTIAEMERKMILRTLAKDDVSQKRAAEQLGISARTIRNKLQQYREAGFSV